MKKLVYIGNKLARHGKNLTSIETLGPALEREGFTVWYASSAKNKLFRMLDMVWTTIKHSRSTDYVLIDTYSTQNFWFALVISQLCRLLGKPYIPKLHGGDLPNRLKEDASPVPADFGNAHINIAPSSYLMDAFRDAGFDNLVYVPNTIDLSFYTFTERNTIKPKLLWVRSFSTIYNPEMAIRTASALNSEYPDVQLCMIGPDRGGLMEKIRNLAKLHNVSLHLPGKMSKEEWTRLSRQYDIFINTTHFDNTPVSVIEAMALGMPVVSTNVGGLPFLLTDRVTALLVNDNDHEAMVARINELIHNPSLVEYLTANGAKMVSQFDFKAVKVKWFEILK